jgi:dolichyl-phosphate-mannose-protein mannosyltransferase
MVNGEATTESVDLDNLEYIKDGDIVRIYHQLTGRNLHSHVIRAPISTKHWEVSCYGDETIGDTQDNWIVEIIKDKIKSDTKQLHALTTRFRLKNVHMNCYLASHSKLLPQWGFRQNEVYCDRYSDGSSPNTWWNIEEHHNEKCNMGFDIKDMPTKMISYSATCL